MNIFKLFYRTVTVVFVMVLMLLADIYLYSDNSHRTPADAAIVLGAAVWSNRPSPVFRERINHAVQLYKDGVVKKLIFTGGLAQGDQLAESEAARKYAHDQGVDLNDILIEDRSRTTCENLIEAKVIIDSNHFNKVLVVSDPMHMRRAMWMADELEIDALPSPTLTTRYQSFTNQAGFLFKEMYYFLPLLIGIHNCS